MYINGWIVLGFCIAFIVSLIAAVAFSDRSRIAEAANRKLEAENQLQRVRLGVAQELLTEKLQAIVSAACSEYGKPDKSLLANNMTADMYYLPITPDFSTDGDTNIIKLMLGRRGEREEVPLMVIRLNMQHEKPATIDGKSVPLCTSGPVDDVEDLVYDFLNDFSFVKHFASKMLEEEGEEILGPLDDHFITVN
jgi:hypothetical protein